MSILTRIERLQKAARRASHWHAPIIVVYANDDGNLSPADEARIASAEIQALAAGGNPDDLVTVIRVVSDRSPVPQPGPGKIVLKWDPSKE